MTATPLRLSELLDGFAEPGDAGGITVAGVATDSAQIEPGMLFLALPGARRHGLDFYPAVCAAGAAAVVYDPAGAAVLPRPAAGCPLIPVSGLSAVAPVIAERFYREPGRRLALLGVTGTDGKTSTAYFIAQCLAQLRPSSPCGLLGTLGGGVLAASSGFTPSLSASAPLTTPDAVSLRRWLADCVAAGASAAVMEVSSHALDQGRSDGLPFAVAVLTQLSRDHLDYHGSQAAYADAKRRLFRDYRPGAAVLNLDDAFGRELAAELATAGAKVYGYGLRAPAELAGPAPAVYLWVSELHAGRDGLRLRLVCEDGAASRRGELGLALLGRFNVSNALAALAAVMALGHDFDAALGGLARLRTAPGRMEAFTAAGRPLAVVDYAHTPHALEQALRALREHLADGEELWCVFGCGGDRDRGKRPLMGAAAERWADRCVITNDNPRGEAPRRIAEQILAGMCRPAAAAVELDRAAAIRHALESAPAAGAVLIAGKGHEDYQLQGDERRPFSDRALVREWLERAA